jgi:hypothetical protein
MPQHQTQEFALTREFFFHFVFAFRGGDLFTVAVPTRVGATSFSFSVDQPKDKAVTTRFDETFSRSTD